MRTVFLVGPEDLSDIVPSISNCVRNGIEPFSTMNMRFYPDHIWPRGAGRSLVEFQRKVLGILSRIRMTSRPMVGWPLPGPNEWAVHPLEQIAKTKVEKRFAPRLTTFMPVHTFLAYFLKRMKSYVTHRWDPRWEAEEDNVRDLAFQWYNGFLRYRQQILEIPRYQRRARTISVQLQLRFQIVQLHRGTYCYHTNALELSLNEGELKGNQPIIQRYWTGAQWCLGDMDLEPSSKEYQLILNIGWLFTWNHIPSWWDSLWEYVNSEDFDRNRARCFLSKHVPRIAKIGDYGSSRGCRDPEGLSKEVENALSQFYIDPEPLDSEAEEEL
ncbi:hypothetical protein Plec18167_001852 [Paecilomyces lecythidis]|uniref:Uncharacterized protein n=1 Tax=Paecilomyces lecythidis TaxID=3004212 RepID=A0ABR3YB16_9EURO